MRSEQASLCPLLSPHRSLLAFDIYFFLLSLCFFPVITILNIRKTRRSSPIARAPNPEFGLSGEGGKKLEKDVVSVPVLVFTDDMAPPEKFQVCSVEIRACILFSTPSGTPFFSVCMHPKRQVVKKLRGRIPWTRF